ncbi:MAG TPA: SAM-dependent methyltransferase [Candidatus Binatia bacterium]|jgi:tRNA-Thr(GGU) m(6)t(6)A37 methyltransferase TsaA
MKIEIEPVGFVRGGRGEAVDDDWGKEEARIELDSARFGADSLAGLGDFSHLLVIYHFHRADPSKIETAARHPRGNTAWPKVGIFAQRGKNRPNRIGVSTCEIAGVEGTTVRVRGLDAIDGTPVLDIKPFFRSFEPRTGVREPAWVAEIMSEYW